MLKFPFYSVVSEGFEDLEYKSEIMQVSGGERNQVIWVCLPASPSWQRGNKRQLQGRGQLGLGRAPLP